MRELTKEERKEWEKLLVTNPDGGAGLQSQAFGKAKGNHGWKPRYYCHELKTKKLYVMYLVKRVPFFGELWYAPNGPGVTGPKDLEEYLNQVRSSTVFKKAFMLRLEPRVRVKEVTNDTVTELKHVDFEKLGIVPSSRTIQTNFSTVIVPLSEEEEMIKKFSSKLRYGIRYAERKGVEVRVMDYSLATAHRMYKLMNTTSKRSGYVMRGRRYFHDFWSNYCKRGMGRFYFAYHGKDLLAGAFFMKVGNNAVYKDGGSTRKKSELNAPSLLLFRALANQYVHGATTCDLHGAMPIDDYVNKTEHNLAGITRFKMSFINQIIEYMPGCDVVFNQPKYALWAKKGERIAMTLSYRLNNQIFF